VDVISAYQNSLRVAEEVHEALTHSRSQEFDRLIEAILQAQGIFCTGQGRSGLMISAFGMRLVHLGLKAHVVGEMTTPAIGSGDPSSRLRVTAAPRRRA
jgi:6-phospho-3-hexuloisomerase